ncbi:MAG TPA: PE-PPE domain-containing protein, partial [Mycobacterium sp.]|nr:PE-PPE domain-containing protein [Mycobacterium sp.]
MAVALGVGNVRRTATRMTVSIGVAVLVVMTPVTPVSTASASSSDLPPLDKTALIMGTSGVPTPDDFYVESVNNQFIAPTHPGQDVEYVKVTTPEGLGPFAGGLGRLVSLLGLEIGGAPEIFGPGGPAWDVPWWNLTGLFDLTLNQSVLQGVTDLERAMAARGNDDLVIYGYSQSALIANREKRKLAEQYPKGTKAPDIDFVLGGDENLPNGGLFARFPGLYIPIFDWSFNGPAPTDTQFDTVEITHQYDFMADFPLYPLNLVADLNAVLGFWYVHLYAFDVSLASDPSTSPPIKTQ